MSKHKLATMISDAIQSEEPDINQTESTEETIPIVKRLKKAKLIPIAQITPDPNQPRKEFNQQSILELAQSIKEYGIRQPIIVETHNSSYRIVSGERRYRAAGEAGITEIPCLVQTQTENKLRFAQQLIENIHREDFSPIDKARAMLQYKALLGETTNWSEIEGKIGISKTRRKQFVGLLNLPDNIQSEIIAIGKRPAQNQITEKHARALLMLKLLPEKQAELFQKIKTSEKSITGDQAIEIAKKDQGNVSHKVLKVIYATEKELLQKLQHIIAELKRKGKVVT